jgi:hypothetical protein
MSIPIHRAALTSVKLSKVMTSQPKKPFRKLQRKKNRNGHFEMIRQRAECRLAV